MDAEFSLNPSIDVETLSAAYRAAGRVRIEPFLSEACADRLAEHLRGRQDWLLNIRAAEERALQFDRRKLGGWSAAQMQAMRRAADPRQLDDFRHVYDSIPGVSEDNRLREAGSVFASFCAFLSSVAVLELFRNVTGKSDIAFADAFASRYGPGDFLTLHHDKKSGVRRIAAYALGLTRQWRPEWGGLLLFHDANGDVSSGFAPQWNSLNLFSVPQDHSVSQVCAFAAEARLSVTGWLHAPVAD